MRKILIISYLFAPENIVGAIRPTKWAKFLSDQGYEVTVVCGKSSKQEDLVLKRDSKNVKKIIRIEHTNCYTKFSNKILQTMSASRGTIVAQTEQAKPKNNKMRNLARKCISNLVWNFLDLYRDIDFYKKASVFIKKNMNLNEYEFVISSYWPIASHLLARWVKRRNQKIKWLADFRDPILSDKFPVGAKNYVKNLQKSFCEEADYIIAVSKGNLKQIADTEHLYKAAVITNGYDISDFEVTAKGKQPAQKLTLIYTGTTYAGKRDLSPLFRAINELDDERKINKHSIQFYYAGNEGQYVKFQAQKYHCGDIMQDFNFVSRETSLELQSQSHLLVVTTWNEKKHQGVLPGKFLEYMLFKKPIIAIVCGDVKKSEIAQIIDECQLGVYYEQAQHDIHFSNLKEYIFKQYESFMTTGNLVFSPLVENVNRYSYDNLSKQLTSILDRICKE